MHFNLGKHGWERGTLAQSSLVSGSSYFSEGGGAYPWSLTPGPFRGRRGGQTRHGQDTAWAVCFVGFHAGGLSCSSLVFTTRIRRMREGNSFSLSTLAGWGYPVSGLDWGVPHPRSRQGGTPSQGWTGVLHSADGGYPHPRSRWGYPPVQDWMGYPSF